MDILLGLKSCYVQSFRLEAFDGSIMWVIVVYFDVGNLYDEFSNWNWQYGCKGV